MDVCKCGSKTKTHMVKEGKKTTCKGCQREDVDTRYAKEKPVEQDETSI